MLFNCIFTEQEEESMIAEVKEWLGLTAPAARDAAKDRKEITSNDTKASTFADLVITPETFDPKDPSKRPDGWVAVRMMRVIVKEQAERVKGVDEETIMESRTKREEEEEATMIGEVVANNAVLGFNKDVTKAGPKLHVEVSRINYEPWNLAKRPPNWLNLRLKRVMLREHIERIGGVNEDVTASQRAEKEFEEEIAMMDEVAFTGRVLGVGEVSRIKPTPDTLPMIQLTASTFDPANALARPKEWKDLLKTRVFVKDQFDMVNGVKEAELAANRAQREADEEEIMITEAQSVNKICLLVAGTHLMVKPQPKDAARESWRSVGLIKFDPTNFDPANPNKRPTGWNSVRRKRVLKKEQLERLRGTKEEEIEAKHDERGLEEEQHMLREVALYGCLVGIGGLKASQVKGKFDSLRNVEDILEVTDENFDPSDASKRPKGWATVKLRRVYLKEWKDRKDGVDDNTIFARRYQREQEAENEMVQEMSVAGRIKRFERLVAMNQSKALLPSGALKHEPQKATSVDAKMQMEKSAVLGNFIKAANQTLETLSEKVSDTLTEKALSPNRAQQTGPSNAAFKLKKNINTQPTAPRVIDTGRGPRGPRPGHSVSVTSAFKDLKTRKGPASVSELGINSNNYDPSNPLKRPAGWADLRARRVEELESKDRSYGLDETIIAQMRTERLAAVSCHYMYQILYLVHFSLLFIAVLS